ncbi:MAG: hypothetical protein Q8P91_03515 [bacterium]|nr:hypothetical protein [bacterium]
MASLPYCCVGKSHPRNPQGAPAFIQGSCSSLSTTSTPTTPTPTPKPTPTATPVTIAQTDCNQGTIIDCSAQGKRCIPDVNGGRCESVNAPTCTPQLVSSSSSCQGGRRQQR